MIPKILVSHSENKGILTYNQKVGVSIDLPYNCLSPSSCSEYVITLPKGLYYLEAWGSQGQNITGRGGYGGYSHGVFRVLTTETKLYAHIGSVTPSGKNIGYNGGGPPLVGKVGMMKMEMGVEQQILDYNQVHGMKI